MSCMIHSVWDNVNSCISVMGGYYEYFDNGPGEIGLGRMIANEFKVRSQLIESRNIDTREITYSIRFSDGDTYLCNKNKKSGGIKEIFLNKRKMLHREKRLSKLLDR